MKLHEIAVHSMKQLAEMLETNREKIDRLVQRMRNDNSDVCLALVESGLLKPEQMCHAALRYELGKSREGKTIFWMIDERHRVRDGMVGDTWASLLLKERGLIDQHWCPQHCLFGLHLLSNTDLTFYEHGFHGSYGFLSEHESHKSHEYKNDSCNSSISCSKNRIRAINSCHSSNSCSKIDPVICVVESVRSCVVLSERFPQYLWMATGYLANLHERLFLPLKGHHVICFPSTDPTGDTYLLWLSVATEARKYGLNITVSRFLEDHATPSQKSRNIDLLDFIYEK